MDVKRLLFGSIIGLLCVTVVGCSGADKEGREITGEPPPTTATTTAPGVGKYTGGPVELSVCDYSSGTNEEEFQKNFAKPVAAIYPQITMKISPCNEKVINGLIAANQVPDIVLFDNTAVGFMLDINLPMDLSSMVKANQIDLKKVSADITRTLIRADGAVTGIPFARNSSAMVYNKDIFDRFAVTYPKDTPTWTELIDLNRRLTRLDNGVQYIGINVNSMRALIRQYDMYPIDLVKKTATITTDGYKNILSVIQQIYTTPGYVQNGKFAYNRDTFFKNQTLAMFQNTLSGIAVSAETFQKETTFKWDLTADPTFEQRPKIAGAVNYYMASITQSSKHKDAAFYALATVLTNEVQTLVSRGGRLTVLDNASIRDQIAADSGVLKGKNIAAVFKVEAAPSPVTSKYDTDMYNIINTEMINRVVIDGVDINTALRDAEEKINRDVLTK